MPFEEHERETSSTLQEKLVVYELGEEAVENDEIHSQEGTMEEVDGEINVEEIDESTTSEEAVEKEIEKVNEVPSGVHKTVPVTVEISDESEDEECHEVLINLVLDCIEKGDTSDSDMFEEWDEISRKKKIRSGDKRVMREVEGTFIEGDLKKVLQTSEQSHMNVETECGNKDAEGRVVEAEMDELTLEREDSMSRENGVELASNKLKDETELCSGPLEASDKIRSPQSDNTSAAKSKSKVWLFSDFTIILCKTFFVSKRFLMLLAMSLRLCS